MTRLAIISDVHADVHALRDALLQIKRLRCTMTICAGDLVDYGLFPEETLALLRESNIPCIRGNHDRWAVREGGDASGWDLSPESVAFLEQLPETWSATIDGVRVAVHHARPGSDLDGVYHDKLIVAAKIRLLEVAKADVLVVGHTHVPMVVTFGSSLIVNPGALLRDPGPGVTLPTPGTFGVLNTREMEFTVHRASDGRRVKFATL